MPVDNDAAGYPVHGPGSPFQKGEPQSRGHGLSPVPAQFFISCKYVSPAFSPSKRRYFMPRPLSVALTVMPSLAVVFCQSGGPENEPIAGFVKSFMATIAEPT